MSNIEDRLLEEKVRLSELSAPEELEARLRKALNTVDPRSKAKWNVKRNWRIAAAVLAVMLFASDHYHALAYYGKTLLGFDEVVNGTLSELNEQGKGQTLNEQALLPDGTKLTINGIMSDENQFILYYTLNNPNGLRNYDIFYPLEIKGFQTDSQFQSGGSGPIEGRTETKGFITFEPVSPLAKELTLTFRGERPGNDQIREITFPYRPDEAMLTKIKQSVNITINNQPITIGTITATPTMTLIEGTLQVENEQLKQAVRNGIDLIANGDSVPLFSDAWTPRTGAFSLQYDVLPENLQSLQLIFKKTGDTVQIPVK
ncbi:DUF4179 domain-containing protein [Paenibacillus sp. Soil522]|uniref:DUF4179 domain-containing protein n=1 Tax=Paenibacillus sp. Soil522 TaxID=1736388 RepID=UPI0006FABB8F|nr:DUF4179 domain-containing protein [Paenibacillus sp. Soil522]KRE30259.1 hypothetical protein ASG81_25280 [Paenibacillus sp. Soil522]